MKLGELIEEVEQRFRGAPLHYGHGTDNARDEAAWLVLRAHGLAFDADLGRSATQAAKVRRLAERRIRERLPLAYLLNEAWLGEHAFYVDPRVIIPRSHLAPLLRAKLRPWVRRAPARILDLCTGSGCLAILAAHEFPAARVDAVDLSAEALAVARKNILRHGLRGRVRAIRSDLFGALGAERYDVILTNPPYVDAHEMRALPREYRHEPRLALAGGADGMELVRRIVHEAGAHLAKSGVLLCEIGAGRRAAERALRGTPLQWPQDEVFVLEAGKMG